MKTAVEWFVNELKSSRKKHLGYKNIDIDFKDKIEQAKEMEKEQIMQAFEAAEKYCGKDFLHGDLYYNETFKSE
jgi:hypothetical protein